MFKFRNKNSAVRVSLTGGLGNQLFQLAFALSFAGERQVILESALGKPRLNTQGLPELMSFGLPEQVSLSRKMIANRLSMKVSGFLLRQGIEKKRFESKNLIVRVTKIFGAFILSLTFRRPINPLIGQGVGFFAENRNYRENLLLGYFQSYRWASSSRVQEKLKQLQLRDNLNSIQSYSELARVEIPLVVHVRLGDYKQEDLFGIPPRSYYLEAIKSCWDTGKYNSVWAFSDEVELANELYGDLFPSEVRWITEFSNSAAFTLEVMRLGHGYVIANSTFSWWGAFLSHNQNCQVISPSPWFIGLESPKDLVPTNWVMLEY